MKAYFYRSPRGRFIIKQQQNGRWGLWFGEILLGSYRSPIAAADDVYMQCTGSWHWDSAQNIDIPTDLSEWKIIF